MHVQEAIRRAGGAYRVAAVLGLSETAAYRWRHVVPRAYVIRFSELFGIPLHELAPDLYPYGPYGPVRAKPSWPAVKPEIAAKPARKGRAA